MKRQSVAAEQLDRILRRVHRSRENLPTAELRIGTLMARIRRQPQIQSRVPGWSFETVVWRLAPATAVLTLALLGVWMNVELIADADLFQLFYPTQYLSLLNF